MWDEQNVVIYTVKDFVSFYVRSYVVDIIHICYGVYINLKLFCQLKLCETSPCA